MTIWYTWFITITIAICKKPSRAATLPDSNRRNPLYKAIPFLFGR